MMPQKRILMLNYADGKDHPRVRREAISLTQMRYKVVVYGAARQGNQPTQEVVDDVLFVLLPIFVNLSIREIFKMIWRLIKGNIGEITREPPQENNKLRSMLTLIFINLWALRLGVSERYDIVHSHSFHFTPATLFLRNWYRAHLIHDLHESPNVILGNQITSQFAQWLQWHTMKQANAVITVGDRLADTLHQNGVKNVIVIGNWRSLDEYTVKNTQQNDLRESLGLESYSLIVSFFGLFMTDRAIGHLIDAVAQSPDVALLIGGRGELQDKVEQYASQYDNIHMFGWVSMEDVARYNEASDVIYCCIEGDFNWQAEYVMPNKVFESFAAGKAILATRGVGEMAVLLEQTGSAHFIDDNSPESMCEAFEKLMDRDYLEQLQKNAFDARELYTWELAEERLKTIYDGLYNSK